MKLGKVSAPWRALMLAAEEQPRGAPPPPPRRNFAALVDLANNRTCRTALCIKDIFLLNILQFAKQLERLNNMPSNFLFLIKEVKF